MGIFKADRNKVSFFYESGTYATASGTAQWVGQVQEAPVDEEVNRIRNRYQGTNSRNVDQFVLGPEDYTGNVTYNPQDWKMLVMALGSNVDAGSPSPYSHTISEADNTGNAFTSGARCPFMSFGLEVAQQTGVANQNFIRTLKGCNVDTLTISASQGEKVSVSMDYVAESLTIGSGAASSPTASTTRPFLWDDTTVEIGGAAVVNLLSMEYSIANNPDSKHLLNGSKQIASPTMDNREHNLTLTVEGNSTQSASYYDTYFKGGSAFNAQLKIDASTGSRDMIMTFSGCNMVDYDAPQGMEGTDEHTITIEPQTVSVVVADSVELYNPW